MKHVFILYACIFGIGSSLLSAAQAQTIRVFSAADSMPVATAHVCYTSDSRQPQVFLSDVYGRVSLVENADHFPFALQISCLGYETTHDTLLHPVDRTYYLKPSNVSIDEVVVTGQYAPGNAANAVQVIKVINREKIDLMAAQNLRDVLSNELNIRLSQDNVLGSSMSLQGISGENIKILIDGVPVIGRLNGNIDISQIHLNNVERIEIVEGPLSVNYGTNALAGTINVIMKKNQDQTWHINNSDYYESNGQYNFSGKLGYQKKRNTIQLNFGRNYFDGWNEGDKPFRYKKELASDNSRAQSWKPKEQYYGGLIYTHRLKDIAFSLSMDVFDEKIINRGVPRAPYGATAFDDIYKTFRSSNSLHISGKVKEHYQANLIFSYNYFKRTKNTFFKDLTTLEQKPASGAGNQDTSLFKSLMSRGNLVSAYGNDIFNYEAGYEINYETGSGYQIKDREQQIGDYALFATAEYRPVRELIIKPGLRVAYNTVYKAPLIPSLNIKYRIPFSHSKDASILIFRASYARGFRSPSLKELYFSFVDLNHDIHGNEELKAEYSNNFIFNVNWQKIKNSAIFKLEWNSFYNDIQNRIVLAQLGTSANLYTYANLGDFQTFGTAFNSELAVNHFKLSLSAGLVALANELSKEYGDIKKFSFTPETRASFLYEWKQQQMSFALMYKYTGKMPGYSLDADGNVQQNSLQDFHTADLTVSKVFASGKFSVSLGSKNLFNVTSIEGQAISGSPHGSGAYSVPLGMGRTYFFQFNLNLNYK